MQGKIVKGIAGFYYCAVGDELYECKAKGIFRKDKLKPLVGDNVELECLDEEKRLGNIIRVMPRSSELIRPAVANVDQALIIFAVQKPAPNLNLLDRFLILMEQQKLPCIICFNKVDLDDTEYVRELAAVYESCGFETVFVSAREQIGIDELRKRLADKTTTVAGPSGVGKSSLINLLQPKVFMETGEISMKIDRGKHTTRHSELIAIDNNTYILDTPGFSSLEVFQMKKEELAWYYPEFEAYEMNCKFTGCSHISEPVCGIKEAVREGSISAVRYENYKQIYQELASKKQW